MYIKQLNIDKSKLANDNLRQMLLHEKTPSIFMIQEPYYFKNRLVGIPKNYKSFGVPKSRAIIIAHESLNLIFSNEFSTEDITVCLSTLGNRYFASIYLDIHKDVIHPNMTKMAEFFAISKSNALWCLDSNAHSNLWGLLGTQTTNIRGETLEYFLMTHSAYLLNDGQLATFENSRFSSIIDLSIAFGQHDDIVNWKVDTECFTFSAHKLITMEIRGGNIPRKKYWSKINWAKFKETIKFEEVSYSTWDKITIESESKKIEDIICKTIKDCTTLHKVSTFKDTWWTDELYKQKQLVVKLYHNKMRNRSTANVDRYAAEKKSYMKNIRKAKRASWIEFVQNIDSPKQISHFNKIINRKSNQEIGLLKFEDGRYARSVKDSINILMQTHLPGCVPPTRTRSQSEDFNVHCDKIIYDLNFDSFINEEKVKMAFDSFKPSTAAGKDGIKFLALQLIGSDGIKRITNLYKAIVEIGYTPKKWLECKLIFIPKPSKDRYDTAKSFRGISLLQTLLKGLEKLIHWELEETVLKYNPLNPNQYAFKRGSSTEHCLSAVTDLLESSLSRSEVALAVFNDISQAFDNCIFSSVISTLEENHVPLKLINWYKFYISNRFAETTLQGVTVKKRVLRGIQQGAILSPLIWNWYYDRWLNLAKGSAIKSIAFADDGLMVLLGSDPNSMVDIMQSAIDKTVEFGLQENLKFNPDKTVVLFFNRKNKWQPPKKKLKMSGKFLEYSDSTHYLGVTFDTRLTFSKHLEKKIMKAKKHLMMFRNAISSTWGPSPKVLKWGYNGIILQSLLYGSSIFAKYCKTNTIREKLTKLNRLAACCMCGSIRKSSPSNSLEVLLDLPPLDLKLEEASLKSMLRIIPNSKSKWDGIGNSSYIGHLKWGADKLKKLGIDPSDNDCGPTSLNVTRNFTVNLDSFKSGLPISETYTNCYTDGSKQKNNDTGYGLAVTQGDTVISTKNESLSPLNSVFQSEVFAIDNSCQILENLNTKSVTFFSDSQSGLSALASVHTKSKVVKNCIDNLNKLGESCKIQLNYVAGHRNHTGNEFADLLARESTKKKTNMVKLPTPKSNSVMKISQAMYKEWNQRWISSQEFRQTKIWFPVINRKKSEFLVNLDRQSLGMMVQIITGHCRLNYHESKINATTNPSCRFCQWEDETAWHLIGECPAFWRSRTDIFNYSFLENPPEWKVGQLLKFIRKIKLKELLNPGQSNQ